MKLFILLTIALVASAEVEQSVVRLPSSYKNGVKWQLGFGETAVRTHSGHKGYSYNTPTTVGGTHGVGHVGTFETSGTHTGTVGHVGVHPGPVDHVGFQPGHVNHVGVHHGQVNQHGHIQTAHIPPVHVQPGHVSGGHFGQIDTTHHGHTGVGHHSQVTHVTKHTEHVQPGHIGGIQFGQVGGGHHEQVSGIQHGQVGSGHVGFQQPPIKPIHTVGSGVHITQVTPVKPTGTFGHVPSGSVSHVGVSSVGSSGHLVHVIPEPVAPSHIGHGQHVQTGHPVHGVGHVPSVHPVHGVGHAPSVHPVHPVHGVGHVPSVHPVGHNEHGVVGTAGSVGTVKHSVFAKKEYTPRHFTHHHVQSYDPITGYHY